MNNFWQNKRSEILVWGLLLIILLVAGSFRFQSLDWDQGQYFHPDERAIIWQSNGQGVMNLMTVQTNGGYDNLGQTRASVSFPPGGLQFFIPNDAANLRPATEQETKLYTAAKIQGKQYTLPANVVVPDQPVPDKAINFWNAAFSPLNPRFFAYGSLPMYLIKFSSWIAASVFGSQWNNYANLYLVGRFLSVLFSLGTVLLAFFLGRRAFSPSLGRKAGTAIGLSASAFLAVSVLDIQLAHYLTFDVALTFFVTLTVFVAIGHMRSGSRWSAIRMGAAFGLALACKVSALPLGLALVVAALLYGLYGKAQHSGEFAGKPKLSGQPGEERFGSIGLGPRLILRTLVNLILSGLVTLVVWFIAMPYAFLDFTTWFDRVVAENGMARGISDYPYTRQYVGTIPFLYQFGNWVQWGLSIPLGVLAAAALAYGLYHAVWFRLKAEILLYCWLVPYMLVTFTGEAKFNRYLLPITPVALVLAARLLVSLYLLAQNSNTATLYKLRKFLVVGLGVFIIGWGLVWAISFSQIYGQEHSRITASEWIYQNIPEGARLSGEAWDESLPVSLPNQAKYREQYQYTDWNSYEDRPNDEIAQYWADKLSNTDYIILSSNRLYATIPKLPWRYPVTTQLYEMLFNGDLGFQLAKEVSNYPTVPLVGWQINDDTADESFSVYDHPKVYIFKKKVQLTEVEYRNLFAPSINAPWVPKRYPGKDDLPVIPARQNDGVLQSTGDAQRVDNGKSLLLDKPVDRQPEVNDNGWNQLVNEQQWLAVISWFVMAQVLGLIGLPLALRSFRRLPDKGYILAKPIGAALVALIIFLVVATRLYQYTISTVYMCLAVSGVVSGWLWWRYRSDLAYFWKHNRALIIIEEGVFLLGFVAFVLIRLGNPDLWHPYFGGEKPMEFAQLNAIVRSAYLPPYDPWFSDGYLNYYYYGQYVVSTWVKLTGVQTSIAFNLAIPLLYAFVLSGGFSISFNLARIYQQWRARRARYLGNNWANASKLRGKLEIHPHEISPDDLSKAGPMWTGIFGAFALAIAANIDGLVQLLQHNRAFAELINALNIYPVRAEQLRAYDYFRSTRVIPDTINEFPYFSFLYADLHAHLIALPFTLLLLALALNLISANWTGYDDTGYSPPIRLIKRLWYALDGTLLIPLLFAVVIGLIGATNIWDLPTYIMVIFMSLVFAFFRRPYKPTVSENEADEQTPRFRPLNLLVELAAAGVTTGLIVYSAFLMYSNFFNKYQALYSEVKLTSLYSDFGQIIFFWLMPLFFVISYAVWSYWRWLSWRKGWKTAPTKDSKASYKLEEELDDPFVAQPATLKPARAELAFAIVGTGSSLETEMGESSSPERQPETNPSSYNRYSVPWIIALGLVGVVMVIAWFFPVTMECKFESVFCQKAGPGITHTGPRWASFATMGFLALAFLFLIFGRAYDPDPEQSAHARNPANLFAKLMILAAFCIIAGLEVVYLADDFATSYRERANSIFKFYYQAWTMLALASAFATYVLWTNWIAPRWSDVERRVGKLRLAVRFLWIGAATMLAIASSLYAILVTPTRIAERMENPLPATTLDGRAYFDTLRQVMGMPNMPLGKSFDMLYEAQSLHEFYDKIQGTPVVLQASIWPYRGNGSWIAINTGLPIVLGYDHHESQQHYDLQVWKRSGNGGGSGDIHDIYDTADIESALSLINYYHITYIHLGIIERESDVFRSCYPGELGETIRSTTPTCYDPLVSDAGLNKFDKMVSMSLLEVAYQNPGVTVLKVTPRGRSGIVDPAAAAANPGQTITTDPKLGRLLDAVKRNPLDYQSHYDLGVYYFKRGDLQEAAQQLIEVIRIVPNEVNPYHVLGDIFSAMGESEKALSAWKEPTIRAPQNVAGHNKYAMGLAAAEQNDEAIKEYNIALQLNPKFVEAAYHLGEFYEKLNKRQEAINAYNYVMQNAPNTNDFWANRSADRIRVLSGR
ncbi:DUF2298 domain-containing protein [Candidatus Chlorohelix sp.]|uniref:DUF2298 domain-containing protein n=1 Tax=Candidatus Chlorohelix sp. TaxID=3139201 RepID=UPI00306C4D89